MAISTSSVVPFRHPFFDERGNMTRTWILFFEQMARSSGALTRTLDVALPDGAGTTTISAPNDASEGSLLAVEITQGGSTGGQEIAWSAQFAPSTTVDIPMEPGERTRKLFVGKADGLWYEFSQLG